MEQMDAVTKITVKFGQKNPFRKKSAKNADKEYSGVGHD
jgi:hypothetical protein